jgi:acyl carrier protein
MNSVIFYKKLASVLDVEGTKIKDKDELKKFKSWDSLGMMSFVITFKDLTKKKINPVEVGRCKLAGDLKKLVL